MCLQILRQGRGPNRDPLKVVQGVRRCEGGKERSLGDLRVGLAMREAGDKEATTEGWSQGAGGGTVGKATDGCVFWTWGHGLDDNLNVGAGQESGILRFPVLSFNRE